MSQIPGKEKGDYQVPNEEEIHAQLDMEDKLKNLAQELEEKQKEFEYYKERALEKKVRDIEDKKGQLRNRLEEINNMPDYETSESKMKAIETKKKIMQWEQKEREKHEELVQIRKEQELEKIVRKKMELERLLEEKKSLNTNYRHVNTQLVVIQEEKEKKDMNSVKLLEKALERGNVLKDQIKKGALSEKDKVLLADTYLQDTIRSKEDQERLLYEIQAHRFQESQKANIDTKEKIKNLNDIRFALREKEEQLLKQKALHHEMMKKGVDYLAQIELGNAPPKEFIEKNLKYNLEDYRNGKTLTDVLKNSENYMHTAQEKIEQLEEEHDRLQAYLARHGQYNGELKAWLAQAKPNSLEAARYILDIILGKVFERINEDDEHMRDVRKEAQRWEDKAKKNNVQQNFMTFTVASKAISTEILDNVVRRMMRELAFEMYNINEDAKTLTAAIIFRGLRLERKFRKTDAELEESFFDLRRNNKPNNLKFKNKEDINYREVKGQKKKGKEEEEEDQSVHKLDPDKECIENLGSFEVRKLELGYFEKVGLENGELIDVFSKIKGGISTMALSSNGHYLAVASTNGIIGVINLKLSPAQLCFFSEESSFSPHILKFSNDSSSQLVALDQNGVCKTYLLSGNPLAKLTQKAWLPQKDPDLRPLEMTEYSSIDWKYMNRPQHRVINEKENLKITQCSFFPRFTILGFQTDFLLGSRNGTILKFNNNKKPGGVYMQNHIFKTTNVQSVANMDPDVNKDAALFKPKEGPADSRPHNYREFFVEHESEIIFITTTESPTSILTVDKDGRIFIWEYNQAFMRDDSTFIPKMKFQIQLDVITYHPTNERSQVFPPKGNLTPEAMIKQGENKFKDYDKSGDFKSRVLSAKKTPTSGLTEVIVFKDRLPSEGGVETFQFITFNYQEKRVVLEQEQNYKAVIAKGFVGKIQSSVNNRFIFIQLILPHKLKSDSNNIVYIGFNTQTNTLKKLKITLEVPRLETGVDFLVCDNFAPMGSSYIYMLLRDGVYIISAATGLIVKIVKDHMQQIDKSLRSKFEFDQLQVFRNKDLYLASSGSGLIWKFGLNDFNSREEVASAKNEQGEFVKLMNL